VSPAARLRARSSRSPDSEYERYQRRKRKFSYADSLSSEDLKKKEKKKKKEKRMKKDRQMSYDSEDAFVSPKKSKVSYMFARNQIS
jgi:hypothetical protein